MRWDGFFNDLDGQISAAEQLGFESEIIDRARAELAGIDLADRLRGALGSSVAVLLASNLRFEGVLSRVGEAWFFLEAASRAVLVRSETVLTVAGLPRLAARPDTLMRHSFGSVVRLLARDRELVTIHLAASTGERAALSGVIDRVGRDYCELTIIRDGEARRARNVAGRQTVPFSAIAAISSAVREPV